MKCPRVSPIFWIILLELSHPTISFFFPWFSVSCSSKLCAESMARRLHHVKPYYEYMFSDNGMCCVQSCKCLLKVAAMVV